MLCRGRLAVGAAVMACVALLLTSCAPKPAALTSAWPLASVEPTIPAPPMLERWPLTGLSAPDASAIVRRPLSVSLQNAPAARPQSGLNEADVVYETVAEGGVSRFNCIFQSSTPQVVGPVGSARLSDPWIVAQYQALFFFSGGSAPVDTAVRAASLAALSPDFGESAPFFRMGGKPATHNYYLLTDKGYAEAERRGLPVTIDVPKLQFEPSVAATPSITRIDIPFSPANHVRWTYDPRTRMYLRVNDERVHRDAATGKQVSAKNVVVMWAKYATTGNNESSSRTNDVELGGQGRASVFHDGQRSDGTWAAGKDTPPRFLAADGTPIKLAPGTTWIQVIDLSVSITMR